MSCADSYRPALDRAPGELVVEFRRADEDKWFYCEVNRTERDLLADTPVCAEDTSIDTGAYANCADGFFGPGTDGFARVEDKERLVMRARQGARVTAEARVRVVVSGNGCGPDTPHQYLVFDAPAE